MLGARIDRFQTRAFSQSLRRPKAEEEAAFDPSQLDRESDEVDVCIVGGGKGCETSVGLFPTDVFSSGPQVPQVLLLPFA